MKTKELWELVKNRKAKEVSEEILDEDDHGNLIESIFEVDGKFWMIHYEHSLNYDYNTFRQGECDDPVEVWPKEVKKIIYTTNPNE